MYGIVFLENLNFHDRSYFVRMTLSPTEESVRVLNVETTVHHSLGADYFANVYIPDQYTVLNKKPYLGAEAIPGYKAYQMNMKRKYRDVLSSENFIIAPKNPKDDISPIPILVNFENLKQQIHKDQTYHLATAKNDTKIDGPQMYEPKYPHKWGT